MPDALGSVGLFSSLNRRELGRLRRAGTVLRLAGGAEVVAEGAPGDAFYLVVRGTATVRRNRRKAAVLGPGDYFGELALLDGGPRTATVVADEPVELLAIERGPFARVLEEVPAVGQKLLVTMAARLRDADRRAATV
ncbi:MAG: cyclic nucleotide-binding domain-containing protein [Actinomycetota bacterium]|nr:cyclic nucleotide-binding domain-containing protein [Actinomycetota bacterium]